MLENVVLLAQIMSVAAIAAWLSIGVWDNLLHPENNEIYTSEVMSLVRMKDEYPAEYAPVAHRAVTDRGQQVLMFRIVVLAEIAATVVLWAGVVALGLALVGAADLQAAKAIALLGALLFTAVWSGVLIVGNYFCYWFCHEGGQNTHYQMTLWGMATMILLVAT